MTIIRRARLSDLPAIYRACLRTGASGADATEQFADPDLLGHVYAGPYVVGEPEHAYVAVDTMGVAGYVLAAPETTRFEAWAEREWWPALRQQYPLRVGDSLEARVVGLLHHPERRDDAILADYPSHLHIDLLPRVQGQGLGRALMEHASRSVGRAGSYGIHLGVAADNSRALSFYEYLGFTRLAAEEGSVTLGRRLAR